MSFPEPGQTICNRYVVRERIGSGGHGEIWSATDEHDGQTVALKFLREDLGASVESWAILNHESQMARRLNHPGILRTGTPLREGDRTVLPMEYAGGGDLKRLRGQSYLRSVPVLIRIAEILAHAHARGVVHRDLKPGNVLFDEQGSVRLADFGASGLSGSRHSHAQGSPFSASPQQLKDLPAAPADDIYGLGALAFELLSGNPPFHPNATTQRVLNEPVTELQPVQPAPDRLIALILRMLAKDPAARPPTMTHVVEGLNQALSDTLMVDDTLPAGEIEASEPVPVATLPPPAPPAAPPPPPPQRPASVQSRVHGRDRPFALEGMRAERRPASEARLLPAAAWLGGIGVVLALVVGLLVLKPWDRPAGAVATVQPEAARPVEEPPAVAVAADAPEPAPAAVPAEPAAVPAPDPASLRQEGASLEAQERWREALELYQRVLEQDATQRFAQQGLSRARERAELSDRLDAYLQHPSLLESAAVRAEARRWAEHGRLLAEGPVLRSQVTRVELLLSDRERATGRPGG